MKLQDGVHLHLLPSEKFKTNRLQLRFSAPFCAPTVAGRVLVANLLEVANQDYPTAHTFRKHLASLYGITFSTQVSRKGQVHYIDLGFTYVKAAFLPEKESLLHEVFAILEAVLCRPLVENAAFDESMFAVEKANLLSFLASERDDAFYQAEVRTRELFFADDSMQLLSTGREDLVAQETAQSAYESFKSMLENDQLDIFVFGDEKASEVIDYLQKFSFSTRKPQLQFTYQQPLRQDILEQSEQKEANQSVLQLGYRLPLIYNSVNYPALLVFNGLFGGYSHSKLFTSIREEAGIAYTVGSQFDVLSGLFSIYIGLDMSSKEEAMHLVDKQWSLMRSREFTEAEIDKTKELLLSSFQLVQDKANYAIEKTYNEMIVGSDCTELTYLSIAINQVTPADIQGIAEQLKLQTIYFLEGTQ